MGFADFPVEIFKALRSKPSESPKSGGTPQLVARSRTTGSLPTGLNNGAQVNDSAIAKLPALTDVNTEESNGTVKETKYQNGLGKQGSQNENFQRSNSSSSRSSQQDSFSPRSPTRPSTDISANPGQRNMSENQLGHIPLEAAVGAGKSLSRIVGAGLKSPMDFTLSLARGFHNAPKLYGDESVRRGDKITGFQSGLKAAGKVSRLSDSFSPLLLMYLQEFGLGFYDGISGLVTQPFEGAKKQGVAGLIKGFGKGIGGVVLKPGAGKSSRINNKQVIS